MRIVVGHANPDFDAYASTIAATKLYPGSVGVFLGSQNANVREFHNLHEEFLSFVDLKGLDLQAIDSIVMVDTHDPDRLAELAEIPRRPSVEVVIYDHHPPQEGDLHCADDHSREVGATTSILVHEVRERAIEITALEASVMLLGIHEDTGSLTYPGTTAYDADAAAWLMANGADIEVLNQFLSRTLDPEQRALLGQLTGTLRVWSVNGQEVAVGTAEADDYVDSAGVLTHYIVEDMGFRVAIAVVRMPERLQVVARSRVAEIDVGAVMVRLGGGGHPQAAAAGFRDLSVEAALERVRQALEAEVRTPLRAVDVMSGPVRSAALSSTMQEAGEEMARWGHGGLPVMDGERLAGLVTRKDVDKALRHGLGHAPVTGFMARDVVTVPPETDLSSLEHLLASRGIGRVPVVEGQRIVGIVTRKDVLRAEHGDAYLDRHAPTPHPEATARFLASIDSLLPREAREALTTLGEVAVERGVRAHVVGGFVRDMLVGRRNLDIDVVVEGDGVEFAETVAARLGLRAKVHRRFGTAVLPFSRDFHVDVTTARTEYYQRPGALPTVERSTLRQDLFRRDFTINAMAACLDPDCFGAIADPFGGLRDLETGTLRVLHALSFVDDPTRVLRAARFEQRYRFSMDADTEGLARRAVEMDMLAEVSGARIREELLDIFAEAAPATVFSRLETLGALPELLPRGVSAAGAAPALFASEDALLALDGAFARPPRRVTTLVATVAGLGSRQAAERWLRHFRFGREYLPAAVELAEKGPVLVRELESHRAMRNSRLYRLLDGVPAESIAVVWSRGEARARERIGHFLREVARMRPAVTGADLIAMGATPSEAFSAILARARDDRLDGRVVGRDAELENARRLARKAGLIGSRKDGA